MVSSGPWSVVRQERPKNWDLERAGRLLLRSADGGGWTVRSRSRILSCRESGSARVPDGTGLRFGVSKRRWTTMQHRYPCGGVNRRGFLAASAASVPVISAVSASSAAQAVGKTSHVGGDRQPPSKFAAPG